MDVLLDLDIRIAEGEFVTLFGPNGSGKTTLLNLIAGLDHADAGTVERSASENDLGYVFQSYAETLLPWRTIRDNVALPLRARGIHAGERVARADAEMRRFGILDHADRYPYELSGGLRQLVAIARSTIYHPALLLLDEPFSALDYANARHAWQRFRSMWAERPVTTICVSHNLDEAIFLGDRVCVLGARPGRIVARHSIPLGRDRDVAVLSDPRFQDLRAAVLETFVATGAT
jgi:NitT/TauT family transport system ATP-binding protein